MIWERVGNIAGKSGRDGKDGIDAPLVDIAALAASVLTAVRGDALSRDEATALVQHGIGEAVSSLDLTQLVKAAVEAGIAELPRPRDGKDGSDAPPVDTEALAVAVFEKARHELLSRDAGAALIRESLSDLRISALVKTAVDATVAALPIPADGKDGKSVDLADIETLVEREVTARVAAIPLPKDGVGMLSALIDRNGQLVVTLSDGTTKELGMVVGHDADMREIERMITEKVALIPVIHGKDGVDGLGFDDFSVEHDPVEDPATFSLKFTKGDREKTFGPFRVPRITYRNVFEAGKEYSEGDAVTYAGSLWIARAVTRATPGAGATPWQLAVKKGADGREGKPGTPGKDGPKGPKGDPGGLLRS
jgi:hypothetical protein